MAVTHKWKGEEFLAQMRKNVEKAVAQSAFTMVDEVKNQLNKHKSPPSSSVGSPPGNLTGTLSRSIQTDLSGLKRKNPRARIGPDMRLAPYARIQELGGPIFPKKGKYLPIPIGAAGRKARRSVSGGSLRQLDLTFIRPKGGGNPLLVKPILGGKAMQILFVLVKRVDIPKRPYLKPAAQLARPKIRRIFAAKNIVAEVR